jgi:galactokinase
MTGKALIDYLKSGRTQKTWENLYGTAEGPAERYAALVEEMLRSAVSGSADFVEKPGTSLENAEFRVFTAAGRTELGGNHTDHNLGKVLAASIQMDQAAVVCPRKDNIVFYRSAAYPDVKVDLSDLSPQETERGSTEALVRGIAAGFTARGIKVGGFSANAASTVLPGSGLSSSAAVEVLLGRIFDNLYGGGNYPALEIARIGQQAENDYFGKPCGLMDQIACASGGTVAVDFAAAAGPAVRRINFDLAAAGYTLCVVNTRGSHADLTADYAAIPGEMKAVAAFFGRAMLRDLDRETVLAQAAELRKAAGDRALLRALHFYDENERVDAMTEALGRMDAATDLETRRQALFDYLDLVNESGDSSWELLQNIYSPRRSEEQGIGLALALSRRFFREQGSGSFACRVHGGGFAGTIQAYMPLESLAAYRTRIEQVFGPGSVTVLRIRPIGAEELWPGLGPE